MEIEPKNEYFRREKFQLRFFSFVSVSFALDCTTTQYITNKTMKIFDIYGFLRTFQDQACWANLLVRPYKQVTRYEGSDFWGVEGGHFETLYIGITQKVYVYSWKALQISILEGFSFHMVYGIPMVVHDKVPKRHL